MHNHLHPREVGLISMEQLLIIAENEMFMKEATDIFQSEYDEYIFLLKRDEISLSKDIREDEFENFDIHLLKLTNTYALLIFRNGEKLELDINDFEETIHKIARKLIEYYHLN